MPTSYPIDDERVQAELRRLFRRSALWMLVGVGVLVGIYFATLGGVSDGVTELMVVVGVCAFALAINGAIGLWGVRKRRQILSTHQWRRATLKDFAVGFRGPDSADLIIDDMRRTFYWYSTRLGRKRDIDDHTRDVRVAGWYPNRIVFRSHDHWKLMLARPSRLDLFLDWWDRRRQGSGVQNG